MQQTDERDRSAHLAAQARQEAPRAFYEGKWVATNRSVRSLKNVLVKKERFFLRHLGQRSGALLELGCGGGWRFFARFAPSVGVDLSLGSLRNAARIYTLATQSAATRLPFADASFDVVVSMDVFGHIAAPYKDQVVGEIVRVLRPGGLTLHYIETESNDPLSTFARRYPDLHERYVVAPEGHIGAESPAHTFVRFRRAGLEPLAEIPAYKGLLYADRFVAYFDNDYRNHARWLRATLPPLRLLVRSRALTLAANLLITLGFELFDHVLPDDWAGGALVAYRKPG